MKTLALLLFPLTSMCYGAVVNLTTNTGASSGNIPTASIVAFNNTTNTTTTVVGGELNGGYFFSGSVGSGSGTYRALYRINSNQPQTSGYNRNGVMSSTVPGGFDPYIRVSDLIKSKDNNFYVFSLDANEPGNQNKEFISLDEFRVYTRPAPNLTTPAANDPTVLPTTESTLSNLGTLRYNMNANGQNSVLANAVGSGVSDMYVFVPVSNFAGAASTDFVYLYTAFGEYLPNAWANDSGFEEWSLPTDVAAQPNLTPIPEPEIALLGSLFLALAAFRRSRVSS